jgi:hypothetical protein
MKFRDMLVENKAVEEDSLDASTELDALVESAGNLKGLPKAFIRNFVRSSESGLGGKNSDLVLYKANAKQKDVTAAARMCGGFTRPEDKGGKFARSYSRKELESQANKKNYAGVVIKVGGEWQFMVSWEEYAIDGGNFQLTAQTGSKTAKRSYQPTGKNFKTGRKKDPVRFDSTYLKAGEISDFIDFDETVEVYVVTTDIERVLKRQERQADRLQPTKVSPTRKKALIAFLTAKSNGIIEQIDKNLHETTDKISKQANSTLSNAAKGNAPDNSNEDISQLIDKLKSQLKDVNSMAYYISGIIKDGKINDKSWMNDNKMESTINYKLFKKMVKELEEKGL